MNLSWRSIHPHLYPIYLAIVPVLCSYAIRAASSQPPTVMLFPLLVSVGACVLLIALMALAWRSLEKAALITAVVFLAAFAPLYIALVASLLGLVGLKLPFLTQPGLLLALAALIVAGGVAAAWRGAAPRLAVPLRSFALYFLLLQLIAIGVALCGFLQNVGRASLPSTFPGDVTSRMPAAKVAAKPDFYYIILDGYANPETLRERFAYDNAAFREKLAGLGFTVITDSFSNYALTELSLTSSLNMSYLDAVAGALGPESEDLSVPCWLLQDHQVLRYLRGQGYRYVNLGGAFGPTAWNFFASDNDPAGPFDMFAIDIWQTSTGGLIESALGGRLTADYYRGTLERILANIERAASAPGPKFVFAHVMLPHPPFMFGSDGGDTGVRALTFGWPDEGRAAYIEQVKYTEAALLSMLEKTAGKLRDGSIVVIQSDHGPGFARAKGEDEASFAYHRLRIFNACKAPPAVSLPERLSPVNTFRHLFNQTLGAVFRPLPDRALLSGYERPYKFTDVTDLYEPPAGQQKVPASRP